MSDVRTVKIKFADLVFLEDNPRTIKKENLSRLAERIKEDPTFFDNRPALVNFTEGRYICYAGFQRSHAAAKILKWKEVPCSVENDVPTETMRKRAILDNTHDGDWDADVLANWEFDVDELGDMGVPGWVFGEDSEGGVPNNALNSEAQEDDFEVPEVETIKTDIVLGDLFEIGPHRLLCGDSTKAEDVERLMGGEKADVCLTDPPYGLGDSATDKNNYDEFEDTKENLVKLIAGFMPLAQDFSKVVVLTPGVKNHRLYGTPSWTMAWFTPAGTGRGPWGFCCWQPILCFGKDPKLAKGKGSHPDAIVHTETSEKNGHPCPKPVNFWAWLMNRVSEKSEVIYDPFTGSGTTLVVSHKIGRIAKCMELSPKYCQITIDRMLKLDPTLEIKKNGQPYN